MPSRLRALSAALPLLVAMACGGQTSADAPGGDSGGDAAKCTTGETKKAPDGCNTCTCGPDGQFGCTLIACLDGGYDTARPDTATTDTATTDTAIGVDARKTDVGVDAAKDPRCPADWTAAKGAHDELCADALTCVYAEGSCTCPPYCGGPPPGPDWKSSWTCTPTPEPRTDGCPDVEPSDGASCAGIADRKVCMYGSCCVDELQCVAGTWKKTGVICPP
jgi:hypothetical protein